MDIESSSEPDSATITWQIKRAASDEGMPIEKNRVEVDREGEESQFSEPIIDNVILQPSDIEALLAARDDLLQRHRQPRLWSAAIWSGV